MRIGSLCSGCGGLDLGLMLAVGGSVAWHAEYDDGPAKILAHHWPDVPNLRDITTADWAVVEPVDWLTAGYPCQPFSLAGKRKGIEDERHLWPYVAAAISALRPGHVLLENVAGHLRLGFDTVLSDLARLGYDAVWGLVRAGDAGAPHRRERLFAVAQDTDGATRDQRRLAAARQTQGRRAVPAADAARLDERAIGAGDRRGESEAQAGDGHRAAADTDGHALRQQPVRFGGLGGASAPRDAGAWGAYGPAIARWGDVTGRPAPRATEPGRTGQRLSPAFVEWLMGLPAGHVTAVPGLTRNAQLKALGNGVVPQQAALALSLLMPLMERQAAS